MKEANFKCSHCHTSFVIEDRYLRHKCKEMIRKEELESPIGQAAWLYYQLWMKTNHRFVAEVKSFLHSKYFNAFLRFAKFVKDVRIPDPELYIRFMVEHDMQPVMFTSNEVYAAFIEHMDKRIPALKNAKISIETLFNLADDLGLGSDVSQVFDKVDPNDLIKLILQRKLSPWLLLKSPKFGTFYKDRLTQDQRILLNTIIRPKIWAAKLKEHPEEIKSIVQFIEELDL